MLKACCGTVLQCRRRADVGEVVEIPHRAHPLCIRGYIAEAPAGHAECLAESRHDDCSFAHAVERCRRNVFRSVVDEVLVDFVGENKEVVFSRRVCYSFQLLPAKDFSAGIRGCVYKDGASAWRDGGL